MGLVDGYEDAEKYAVLPSNWSWARMADLCTLITDGTHQTPKYTTSGRVFISAQNVKPFKFMPQNHRWVSEEDYQGYIKNRRPEMGDVLLTRVGAGIGEAAVIDVDLEFAIYVSVGLLKPSRRHVDPSYLALWLNSPYGRKHSERNTYGKGVSQGNLNLGLIRNFAVSVPPFEEQKRIVAKVDQLMALCGELEAKLNQAQQHSEKLMEATVWQLLGSSTPQKPHVAKLVRKLPETKPVLKGSAKVTAKPEPALALVAETPATYTGNIPQAIIDHMQPGTEYARAEITAALGFSTADWNWAIRQLKEQGRVVQKGERRGARYSRL